MRNAIFLLMLLSLPGCAKFKKLINGGPSEREKYQAKMAEMRAKESEEQAQKEQREASLVELQVISISTMKVFNKCMNRYGKAHANSRSTAMEIAEAAGSSCQPEFQEVRKSHTAEAIMAIGYEHGSNSGDQTSKNAMKSAKDRVIQVVVEARTN